jgi:hypothetical protein
MAILEQTMLEAKKILITTRSMEMILVRPVRRMEGFCSVCGTERTMITLDEASLITGQGTRRMISRIDEGILHSVENEAGRIFVCAASLEKAW